MSTLFSTQDPQHAELDGLRDKINREARANFHNEQFRKDVAQEIQEGIYKGFMSENIVGLFTETINLDLDGRFKIETVEGLKAFWHARGGYIEESDLSKTVREIAPDTIGFRFRQSEDRLRTNFAETAQTLVRLGAQRLTSEINARVFKTYQAAIQSGNPSYQGVTTLSLANLQAALAGVRDNSLGAPGAPVIVGRSSALAAITTAVSANNNFSMFAPETNESLLASGKLGTFWGSRIQEIRNFKDSEGNDVIPGNEIWVILPSSGKTAYFGQGENKESLDSDDFYWNYVYRQDVAPVLINPDQVRRIVISSIPA